MENDKRYLQPGDIVTLKQDIPNNVYNDSC